MYTLATHTRKNLGGDDGLKLMTDEGHAVHDPGLVSSIHGSCGLARVLCLGNGTGIGGEEGLARAVSRENWCGLCLDSGTGMG